MNRQCRLTDRVVAECRPEGREYCVRDTVLSGFLLRVRTSGAKSWVIRGRPGEPSAKTTLGSPGTLTAEEARTKAHAFRARPVVAIARKPTTPKFRVFAAIYRQRVSTKWKESTLRSFDSYLRATLLPNFGAKRLEEISPVDVATWFHTYSRTSPGGANRALASLRSMLHSAAAWGMLPEEAQTLRWPIRRNRRPPRGRLLNQEQIHCLGDALRASQIKHRDYVDAIRLILLTGCRSGEISNLRWSEVAADRLELAQAKAGARIVHLGTSAREILAARPRTPHSPYVFPSMYRSNRPRSNLRAAWYKIRRAAGLPGDVRIHDLRHTFASYSVMGGESLIVTGVLLGHRQAASTARYAHLFDDYLLGIAKAVSQQIAAYLGAASDSNRQTPLGI